jgi:hypothetical protein
MLKIRKFDIVAEMPSAEWLSDNFIRRGKYEKNVSAEQNQARQNTRIPDADVHQSRTENHKTAQSQRQNTPCALISAISELSLKDM